MTHNNNKILSIDVGIKNLAFCLLSKSDSENESNQISILKWDVVDLTQSDVENENKIICIQLDTKGKICNKQAKYKKDESCYCLKHAKKTKFLLTFEKPAFINKQKLVNLILLAEKYGIQSTNYKKTELISLLNSHILKNSVELIEKSNASKLDIVTIGKNIQSNLDVLLKDDILSINTIVIENQISPIANRMKTIQGMIAQYFIMKNGSIKIEFVSSSNKLKDCDKGEKLTYSDRKKLGIVKCLESLSLSIDSSNWKSFFSGHKKKDDLADSYLQGLWYLK
jgi:hypothetical protein